MRRFILNATAALLVVSSGSGAPAGLSSQGVNDPCDGFKMIVIAPPKDIDFKMIIIPVPKNLDKAMVINPCQKSEQVFSSTLIIPTEKKDESIKVPPFTINPKSVP